MRFRYPWPGICWEWCTWCARKKAQWYLPASIAKALQDRAE